METNNNAIKKESIEENKENHLQTKKKEANKEDVWAITLDDKDYVKWSDMTTKHKVKSVAINSIKICLALSCLYLFICSISMLGDAFQILAGKSAGAIFANDSFLSNPLTGLIIGVLITVLLQSSSTSSSIIITMVAAGILQVDQAVYIIMGANVGTSVSNTIVSLTQSLRREEFRRAFAGATVHDIFNLLSILVLLPVEVVSGYLQSLTKLIIDSFHISQQNTEFDILNVITDPFVEAIVVVNETVITLVAQNIYLEPESSMIKIWCKTGLGYINRTEVMNVTMNTTGEPATVIIEQNVTMIEEVQVGMEKCKSPTDFLFANTGLSDIEAGIILLLFSLFLLCSCMLLLVKILNTLLRGSVSKILKKIINTDFKYPFGWVTDYIAMLVGAGLTFVVQSSSVFTSILTPLVGIGVISLKRMYPLTLGANIGTTTTGILAALASNPAKLEYSLQVSLIHLFFNLSGIILWYPIPFMRSVPLKGAKGLGNTTAKYRWFAVLYLIFVFFLIPIALLGLSIADFWALMSVVIVVLIIVIFVVIVNVLQSRKPNWLPEVLRTWRWLPIWLRALKPYDKFMTKYLLCCCKSFGNTNEESDALTFVSSVSSFDTSVGETNFGFEDENKIVEATKL